MNNNQLVNPTTGQPINQNINTVNNPNIQNGQVANQVQPQVVVPQQQVPVQTMQQQVPIQQVQQQSIDPISIQQQMQNIPTVDQNKQEFINNTQAASEVKKDVKKDGPNIILIVILFVIIFAAIFFLFPYLLNVLG